MKGVMHIGLLVVIASLFTVGAVGAVSEWRFGDTVQLIVTTTNMGDVDVVRSTGKITIRDPRGIELSCGDFDVEGVVHPGEAVRVPVSWDTLMVNASLVPGYYDIILDGELSYANGEYEETHSEVIEAFMIIMGSTGLRELPEITYIGDVTGVTQLSDLYYPGSPFLIIVWVENTGSSLFVPEVEVTFTCSDSSTFTPDSQCYYNDVCEPGSHPYLFQCQLPEDIPPGTCQYDVDLQMHCVEVDVTDENYPDGLAGFWHDSYVISEVGSEPDDDWYQFTVDDDPAYVSLETNLECFGYYDPGIYLYESGVWPDPDIGLGYCVQHNIVELDLSPEDTAVFCGGSVDYEAYGSFDDAQVFPTDTHPDLTWTTIPGDEGFHNIEVEVRERTATDIEASDLITVLVDRKTDEDTFPLYIWLTNDCDYAFEPEFTLTIPELGDTLIPIVEVDDQKIAPMGESLHKLTIDRDDLLLSEEGYYYVLTVEPIAVYDTSLSDGFLDDDIPWEFMTLPYIYIPDDHTYDEKLEMQSEANSIWTWTASDIEWSSAGPHTVIVEVTDSLFDPDYSGEGDRIGFATLDVTVTDDSSDDGTDDGTGGDDSSGETGDTGDSGSTTGSEPDDWEEPEDEPSGGIAETIQSIINQILDIIRGLLG